MSDECHLTIIFRDPDITLGLSVVQQEATLFQLQEAPVFVEELSIFDVIELRAIEHLTFEFVRTVRKSGWKTWQFLIAEDLLNSNALSVIQQEVDRLGGQWRRELGGYLIVSLPPHVDYDPRAKIDGIYVDRR